MVAPGYLIDRGHADVAGRLSDLGADVRVEESA
jgi:UDP-N-acetylglucosamine enolpyruvyl transferase